MHHNESKSREYRAWQAIKTACYNKNNPRYKTYGAKGYTICADWHDYCNFIEDMGKMPVGCTGISMKSDIFREFNELTCEWRWNGAGRPRIDQSIKRYKRPKSTMKDGVQVCLMISKAQLDYVRKIALQLSARECKQIEANELIRKALAKEYPLPSQKDMFGKEL